LGACVLPVEAEINTELTAYRSEVKQVKMAMPGWLGLSVFSQ